MAWLLNNGEVKSLNNPHLLEWLKAGDATNPQGAYFASAWAFRAIQLRAEAVASAPLKLYDAEGEEIEEHALLYLLDTVNEEWNKSDLWKYVESALSVFGNAYILKARTGGQVRELYYLNPATVTPKIEGARIVSFERRAANGIAERYDRGDVISFRSGYDPNSDLLGVSPLRFALQAAFGEKNTEKYLSAFFANGAIPGLILTTDGKLHQSDFARIIDAINRMFRRSDNAHKAGVFDSGLKPTTVGYNMKDLALPDVRAAVHQTISTALGVPELLISPTNAADLTPVDVAQKLFYQNSIVPRWAYLQEVLNVELVGEYPDLANAGAELWFDYDDLPAFAENTDAKVERLTKLVVAGMLSAKTAILELGYTEADLPEAKEPEPVVSVSPAFAPMPAMSGGEMSEQSSAASADLRRWRQVAMRSIEQGKPPRKFTSDYISAIEHARITAALAECKTAADVSAVFEAKPADDTITKLLAELSEARKALDAAPMPTPVVNVIVQPSDVQVAVAPIPAPAVTVENIIERVQPAPIRFVRDRAGDIVGAEPEG